MGACHPHPVILPTVRKFTVYRCEVDGGSQLPGMQHFKPILEQGAALCLLPPSVPLIVETCSVLHRPSSLLAGRAATREWWLTAGELLCEECPCVLPQSGNRERMARLCGHSFCQHCRVSLKLVCHLGFLVWVGGAAMGPASGMNLTAIAALQTQLSISSTFPTGFQFQSCASACFL